MKIAFYFLVSLRPKQWVKNVFIFAPVVFALKVFDLSYLRTAFLAFLDFSVIAGCIYVFNDIIDREKDRRHPKKRNRPIASGKLALFPAAVAAAALLAGSLWLAFLLGGKFFLICLVYVILNILYSIWLKELVIIDVMVIALGFVLRVIAGAAADFKETGVAGVEIKHIELSPWILITTFLVAIFMALIKRRQELLKIGNQGVEHHTRKTLLHYNISLLDQMISISTATTLIAYIMYALSPDVYLKFHTHNLYYTVPFVVFGIFRYLFLSYTKEEGESASDIIYSDLPFTLNFILWVVVFIYLIKFSG